MVAETETNSNLAMRCCALLATRNILVVCSARFSTVSMLIAHGCVAAGFRKGFSFGANLVIERSIEAVKTAQAMKDDNKSWEHLAEQFPGVDATLPNSHLFTSMLLVDLREEVVSNLPGDVSDPFDREAIDVLRGPVARTRTLSRSCDTVAKVVQSTADFVLKIGDNKRKRTLMLTDSAKELEDQDKPDQFGTCPSEYHCNGCGKTGVWKNRKTFMDHLREHFKAKTGHHEAANKQLEGMPKGKSGRRPKLVQETQEGEASNPEATPHPPETPHQARALLGSFATPQVSISYTDSPGWDPTMCCFCALNFDVQPDEPMSKCACQGCTAHFDFIEGAC